MSIPYWPETIIQAPAVPFKRSPMDVKERFATEVGEPITRPRTTLAPMMAEAEFLFADSEIDTFETFYADTLSQGSKRFAWRDVLSGEVRMWRFTGSYELEFLIERLARVRAEMMMLPVAPWFSPYARDGYSTVPYFVADYANGVYGIDGVKVSASELPTIAGTYIVTRTTTTEVTTGQETLTSGDIPASAPTNTTLIVGFST